MSSQSELACAWVRKADSDRQAASIIARSSGPYDTACFHAQQAVEKYLKALLALAVQPVPRFHDLEDLYDLCRDIAPRLTLDQEDLSRLTPYAVLMRYDPGFWPDQSEAAEAFRIVEVVRTAVLDQLPPEARP